MLSWERKIKREGQLVDLLTELKKTFAHFEAQVVAQGGAAPEASDIAVARACIETFNAWVMFSRSMYLSCMLGTKSRSGRNIRPPGRLLSAQEAIVSATRVISPNFSGSSASWFDEPKWHNHEQMLRIWARTRLPNLAALQTAYGLPLSSLKALRAARNYYAHRSDDTFAKYSKALVAVGYPGIEHPSVLLLKRTSSLQRLIFQEWLLDLSLVAEEMCN